LKKKTISDAVLTKTGQWVMAYFTNHYVHYTIEYFGNILLGMTTSVK